MAGTDMISNHATRTVSSTFSGEEKRFSFSQPRRLATGRGASMPVVGFALMSALHQRNALVVPVHEDGNREAYRQIGRHDDEDALNGLARLVQGGIDHRRSEERRVG